ncbi:uncharacterized protein LOC123305296 [Chrysoperla carnea]|uniref:uncharacterized protein LOC123305296 n=1 Tax=Chrysoperla carnea TaxID=189513 RepID=UPI001D08E0B0|nr:uncharacterized protein LOC123305296 [Chrysoperla carnea]
MKFLIILSVCAAVAMAQKSPYSFSSGTQIQLASRFQTEEDRLAAQNGIDLGNRFGESSSTAVPLPVDANGDYALIKEIETWPREKQPFWYLNWKQIEAARGRPPTSTQTPTQASSTQQPIVQQQPQQSTQQPAAQQSVVQQQPQSTTVGTARRSASSNRRFVRF